MENHYEAKLGTRGILANLTYEILRGKQAGVTRQPWGMAEGEEPDQMWRVSRGGGCRVLVKST